MQYQGIIFILLLYINYSTAEVINAIGFSLDSGTIYSRYANLFNEYAKEHHLDISINLNLITKNDLSNPQ